MLAYITFAYAQTAETSASTPTTQPVPLLEFAANNEAFDAQVLTQAKTHFRQLVPACNSIEQAVRQLPVTFGDVTFQGGAAPNAAPVTGIWKEIVKMRACGRLFTINQLAVAQSTGDPLLLALVAGDTRLDPNRQRQAERIARTEALKTDTACAESPRIPNTRLIGYKQADNTIGPQETNLGWYEEWHFTVCAQQPVVQLAIMPSANGLLSITARLSPASTNTPKATPPQKPAGLASK